MLRDSRAAENCSYSMDRLRSWLDSWPLVFDQENPKKAGSAAYKRYEAYKGARTVQEALSAGATSKDACPQSHVSRRR